jgi:hypothetical protein
MTDAVASERQINATVALRSLLVRTGPAVVGLMVGASGPRRSAGPAPGIPDQPFPLL